eukprot:g392.t1
MLEVATGGSGGQDSALSVPGTNECVRRSGERMPMLFMFPRLNGDVKGYSMLGMGDVLFPGMLLCFALRFDYKYYGAPLPYQNWIMRVFRRCKICPHAQRGSRRYQADRVGYFPHLLCWYGVGLMMAYLANYLHITINGVQGQPALLYLVPCSLGPLFCLSKMRGELHLIWNGLVRTGEADLEEQGMKNFTDDFDDMRNMAGDIEAEGEENSGDVDERDLSTELLS